MENSKIIHQIFYGNEDNILDFPRFIASKKNTENYCLLKKIRYMFWDKNNINELLNKYEEYRSIFYEMINQTNKTKKCCAYDFIRYLILYEYGGIYIDLDIDIVKDDINELFEKNIFMTSFNEDYHISVIGSIVKNEILLKILDFSIKNFNEKKKMKAYETRVVRFVSNTTGSNMINRFVKKCGVEIEKLPIITIISNRKSGSYLLSNNPFFLETNEASWWENRNK